MPIKLPWRSKVEAEIAEEISPEPSGPVIDIHGSPGLGETVRAVRDDGKCKVLDLGPSVADNVEFVSLFASYVQIVDLIDRGPSASGSGDRLAVLQALVDEHRRSFDLVLAWDVLNYLSTDQAQRMVRSVAELCLPDARLHAIIFATDMMPAVPNRYRIVDRDRLAYEFGTTEMRGVPNLPPAAVEKLLKGFRVEHSFVLQHGVHEYVATRKRWYVKK
jgi:hypothetical protein